MFKIIDFLHFSLFDFIDIFITSVIFYYVLKLFRGTRVPQMFIGLFLIFLLAFFAFIFDLAALKWIISSLKTIGLIAFVIVFQPEIRRALASIGRTPFFRYFFSFREEREISNVIEEIVRACFTLRDRGFGALIVIERQIGLREYTERGGVYLHSKVSSPLIVTIFTPPSPLHDGAIVIRGFSIIAAGCTLPMSESPYLDPSLGMRHKAAVGITEVSDALCIVISEEKRRVSLSVSGKILSNLNRSTLRANLISLLSI